jgi:hypothetical protein
MIRRAATLMVNALRAIVVARTPGAQDCAKEFKSITQARRFAPAGIFYFDRRWSILLT